jgi:hypothetical protein
MPSVPLHVTVSRDCRYLNFDPCVLLATACMPAVVLAAGWAVGSLAAHALSRAF